MNELYELLGVPRTASHEQIKLAYRRMVLLSHPDKRQGEQASALFERVQAAWLILGDAAARSAYDASLLAMYKPEFQLSGEIDLDEMLEDPPECWSTPCRCGDVHSITAAQLERGENLAQCATCSLCVLVHFQEQVRNHSHSFVVLVLVVVVFWERGCW
jgi:curved DNA-binding protein CbpA